jgi:hypothetical protein
MQRLDFLVSRSDIGAHKLVSMTEAPQLHPGEVELRVDVFGFTSNNFTYAALGERMSYWSFFPSPEPGWGRIPTWGFGTVVRSSQPALSVGDRLYGYLPMSTSVVLQLDPAGEGIFEDRSAHRQIHDSVYNQYLLTRTDPCYRPESEAHQAVWRPLSTASFLLADLLSDGSISEAGTILWASASSRTAYGAAFLLGRQRSGLRQQLVGLTSRQNELFTQRLGVYDRVCSYDELDTLRLESPVLYADVSGNATLRAQVHQTFRDVLKRSVMVGATHRTAAKPPIDLPGCQPAPFFAPAQAAKRRLDWTVPRLKERTDAAWRDYESWLLDPNHPARVARVAGPETVARVYMETLREGIRPDLSYAMTLNAE